MGGVHGRHSYSGEWGPTRGWPDTSGMSHLSAIDHADLLATMCGIDPTDVAARHIDDPTKAVATDVELLRSNPLMATLAVMARASVPPLLTFPVPSTPA